MAGCEITHPFDNVVIRASAGTGKTFQLSNRFIALAQAGERPDHILAATFARKAAGEILERVLFRLAEAARDPQKRAELAGFVAQEVPDRPLDRESCLALLARLVRHLHRLRIGTLDSFFVQMAGTFGLELGLPPGWRIVEENVDRALRAQAIQEVLLAHAPGNLVRMMHLLSKGEVARSVSEQIRRLTDDLYDLYRETEEAAWKRLPRHAPLEAPELQAAVETLAGLADLPDGRFISARDKDVERARAGDWAQFASNGLACRILAGETDYYKKPIGPALTAAYQPLIRHARAVLVGQVADQTEGTWRLLQAFDEAYRRLKLEHRAQRFDDVTRGLAEALRPPRHDPASSPDAPGRDLGSVAYRLDAHLCQLLLDEFQDTSLSQWQVLRPFAESVARDAGRSVFCVGDVKQAIYGWRGGLSELFDAVGQELPAMRVQPLDRSFRSSPVVIDVLNRVFETLPQNPVLRDRPEAAALWRARFQTHSSACALPGYVCLRTAPSAEIPAAQRAETLRFAAAETARLHREHPGGTIGILVRKNETVGRLIARLRREHGVLASEEGGNPLVDSLAVGAILSLLTLADHPGDTIVRFHVATSPLGKVVGFEDWQEGRAARRLSRRIRRELLERGYGRTIDGWVRGLAPACDRRELRRLLQLVELAWSYESQATEQAMDFVDFVTFKKVEDPAATDVRVMTIHQAKGLEFDLVLLPDLDVKLHGQPPPVVVGRSRPTAPVETVCRHVGKELLPLFPRNVRQMFADHAVRDVDESLCLLYVAMSRAVHALHLIAPPAAVNERKLPATFAGLLRGALAESGDEPERLLFEAGDPLWRKPASGSGRDARRPGEDAEETITVRLKPAPERRARGLESQSPSGLEGGAWIQLSGRLRLGVGAQRGSLLHKWFEQIEWLEDGLPDDAALLRGLRDLPTAGLDLEAELRNFHAMLDRPAIRSALTRAGYRDPAALGFPAAVAPLLRTVAEQAAGEPAVGRMGIDSGEMIEGVTGGQAARGALRSGPVGSDARCRGTHRRAQGLEVRREHAFAVRNGNTLLHGYIDRLVLFWHDGRAVAADILDFKSDAVDPGGVASRVEYYQPQVAAYRQAVARLFRLDPAAVTARLLFLEPGIVRPVP